MVSLSISPGRGGEGVGRVAAAPSHLTPEGAQ